MAMHASRQADSNKLSSLGVGLRDLLILGVPWWGWCPGGQGTGVCYRPAVRATAATIMPVHGSTGRELSSPVLA